MLAVEGRGNYFKSKEWEFQTIHAFMQSHGGFWKKQCRTSFFYIISDGREAKDAARLPFGPRC